MGSFWGLDDAGKEAQGWPREMGAWSSQQMKDWLDKQNQAYSSGDSATTWNKNWNLDRSRTGIGSVADIQGYGKQIMPGIDQYVSDLKNTANQQASDYKSNVPQAADTMAKINAANSQDLDYVNQTRNANLQDIGDTFARGNAANTATYDRLNAQSDAAYKSALDNTELMKPGGQFQTAQVARNFAPQVSSTAGSLRRMGIDPNSPQGLAAMQNTSTARSRAMDDASAASTAGYVAAKNNLTIGQQADREGLGTGELGNTLNLDASRSKQYQSTQDTAMNRITDNLNQAQGNALLDKTLSTNDWQTLAGLQDKANAATATGINLNQQAWNAGMGYNSANIGEQDQAAQNVGNYGQNQLNYALQAGNQAQNWGNDAMKAYQTAYSYEAPQAGWGAKLLTNAALMGASAAFPGAAPILSQVAGPLTGAVNSATSATGYNQPMSGTYGSQPYGGGGWNPMQSYTSPYGTVSSIPNGMDTAISAGTPTGSMADIYKSWGTQQAARPRSTSGLYDPMQGQY